MVVPKILFSDDNILTKVPENNPKQYFELNIIWSTKNLQ